MRSTTLGYGSRKNRKLLAKMLAVTAGGEDSLFNFSAARNCFSDDGVTQVTPGAAVYRANETEGAATFAQTVLASRPLFSPALGLQFDGVDDLMEGTGSLLTVAQAADAITFFGRVSFGTLAAARQLVVLSHNGSGNRFSFRVLTTGALQFSLRRLDSDTPMAYNTAAGVIVAGTTYSIVASVDYVGNTASIYLDGGPDILAATLTLASPAGPTSNTASLRCRLGASVGGVPTDFFEGAIAKAGAIKRVPSAAERSVIFEYLANNMI